MCAWLILFPYTGPFPQISQVRAIELTSGSKNAKPTSAYYTPSRRGGVRTKHGEHDFKKRRAIMQPVIRAKTGITDLIYMRVQQRLAGPDDHHFCRLDEGCGHVSHFELKLFAGVAGDDGCYPLAANI